MYIMYSSGFGDVLFLSNLKQRKEGKGEEGGFGDVLFLSNLKL